MIRVLVVDDQKLVCECYTALLSREKDIQVVAQARDGQEAIDLAKSLHPDVVTMDLTMPRLGGLQAIRKICTSSQNHAKILVVSMSWTHDLIAQAMQNGASGYVAKSNLLELEHAIHTVHNGSYFFSSEIAHFLTPSGPMDSPFPPES